MILGYIALGLCFLSGILLAELVDEILVLSLVSICGLVNTFITGPGTAGTIKFSSHSFSAANLIARFTGAILGEFITAVPTISECTPSS